MQKLVLYAAVALFSGITVSTTRSETTAEWGKSKLQGLFESAQYVAGSVKDTASSVMSGLAGGDGPENQYCTDDSCDMHEFEPAPSVTVTAGGDGVQLEEKPDTSTQHWNVFSTITDYVTTVKDTVKFTVYKKAGEFADTVYETVDDFAERVRYVFREEFNYFLEVLWESAVGTNPANDSTFAKFKKAVVHKALTIGLIILCPIVSYFLWYSSTSLVTGFVWMLTFNSSVLLIYKLLGPVWVYWAFWKFVGYMWYIISYIWTYPYTSAGAIFVVFVLSIFRYFNEWYTKMDRRQWKAVMLRNVNDKLDRMPNDIMDQLRRMEAKQDEIVDRLKRLEDKLADLRTDGS